MFSFSTTSLRWGISTLGDSDADLDDWMKLCVERGISELELRVLSGDKDLSGILSRLFVSPAGFAAALRSQPARVAVLSSDFRLAAEKEGDYGELLSYALWAEAADIPWLRIFDKCGPHVPWMEDEWGSAARRLRWWREQRARNEWRVDVIVEAHNALFNPEAYRRFCEMTGEEPPLIFDIGHAVRGLGLERAFAAWKELAPHAPRVHFKDVADSNFQGDKHCLPGRGVVPLADFYRLLQESDPQPTVVFEWERFWNRNLPPVGEALDALCSILSSPDSTSEKL